MIQYKSKARKYRHVNHRILYAFSQQVGHYLLAFYIYTNHVEGGVPLAAIINQAPRECRAARIKAGGRKEFIYPDDFPHLREHGGDFYAWQENGIWYIETTLTGKALREKMDGMLPHSHKPF